MSRPLAAALLLLVAAAPAAATGGGPWTGPYQDVALGLVAGSPRFASPPWLPPPAPGRVLIWAFASGRCGEETWAPGVDTAAFAAANVAAHVAAGRDYVISTGGEAAAFLCDSDEGMRRFVERYLSPRLVGLDFDIERDQTPAQIDALVRSVAHAARRWPRLRISFTLATHAASDGSGRGLNGTGEAVLRAVAAHGLGERAVVNLMVMNYGQPDARWCVPDGARCDMARSALQAVRNLQQRHGVPPERIALTVMLGENDVAANVLREADAVELARATRELGLAGLHHWSLDRDQPCAAGSPRVSPRCHGLAGVPAGVFARLLDSPR